MSGNLPAGTRVFFFAAGGQVQYGIVQSTARTSDGGTLLSVRTDSGSTVTLPRMRIASDYQISAWNVSKIDMLFGMYPASCFDSFLK
ncbi:hypothetical protein WG66_004728, partial [Moniliophthora roreri]